MPNGARRVTPITSGVRCLGTAFSAAARRGRLQQAAGSKAAASRRTPKRLPSHFVLNEQIGQYRITARLGQGGMGEIFAARDEKLNRTVAVKFIANAKMDSDASRSLFLRQARAASALDHPFICTVHDVLEHKDQPAIVM